MHFLLILLLSFASCKPRPIIVLQVGNIDPSIIHDIRGKINRVYHNTTVVVRRDSFINFSYIPPLNLYNAKVIVREISYSYPNDRVILVTDKELVCIIAPDFIFNDDFHLQWVYGYTGYLSEACVISTNELNIKHSHSEMDVLAIHELGHTFSLEHCDDPYCYMTEGDGTTASIDKCSYFCSKCLKQLTHK